jgi:hypothetical protein
MKSFSFGCSLVFFLALTALAQQTDPTPGEIKLLPGYNHKTGQGLDSRVGRIWKEDGLKIEYDIGELAGDYATCKSCGWTKGEVWRKQQVINGAPVICVFTKQRRLVISFPKAHANFYATVATDDQLSDMLLMVLTYHGKQPA